MPRPRPPKARPVIFPMPSNDRRSMLWHLSVGPVILETFWCLNGAKRYCKKNRITATIETEPRYF